MHTLSSRLAGSKFVATIAERIASTVERRLEAKVEEIAQAIRHGRGEMGKIDRDYVIWAYRLLLGREPENEAVIEEKRALGDVREMIYGVLESLEFRDQCRSSFTARFRRELSAPKYVMTELEDGSRFWVNLRDVHVSRGILNGMWEGVETSFVRRNVRPGMRTLDIGANLGWFTVNMAKLVGPSGHVTAFEPRDDIHHYLCKTVRDNDLENVKVHNVALGAEEGELMLQWGADDENPGGTHLSALSSEALEQMEQVLSQRTPVRVLDRLVDGAVDFIKIDVEGAEKMVFDGAANLLRKNKPIILSEMAPQSLFGVSRVAIDDYFRYVDTLGYEVFELDSEGRLSGTRLTNWPYGNDKDIINVVLVPSGRLTSIS